MQKKHKSLYTPSQKYSYYPPILKQPKTDNFTIDKRLNSIRKSLQITRRNISPRQYANIRKEKNKQSKTIYLENQQKNKSPNNKIKFINKSSQNIKNQQINYQNFYQPKSQQKQQKNKIKNKQIKMSKIIQSIFSQNQTKQQQISNVRITKKIIHQNPNNQLYKNLSQKYQKQQSQTNPKQISKQIINLITNLKSINNYFFNKINNILALTLINIGNIILLKPKQFLYQQNNQSHSFFILLWGQIQLKNIFTKKCLYCIPGDTLSQEILQDQKQNHNIILHLNGIKPKLQNAKAITHAAVLQILPQNYQKVKKSFCQFGEKQMFYLAHSIIKWNVNKKKQLRK